MTEQLSMHRRTRPSPSTQITAVERCLSELVARLQEKHLTSKQRVGKMCGFARKGRREATDIGQQRCGGVGGFHKG